jgi:hypothetical protein
MTVNAAGERLGDTYEVDDPGGEGLTFEQTVAEARLRSRGSVPAASGLAWGCGL